MELLFQKLSLKRALLLLLTKTISVVDFYLCSFAQNEEIPPYDSKSFCCFHRKIECVEYYKTYSAVPGSVLQWF